MTILYLTPAILSFVFLTLHFFRSDNLLAMYLSLFLIIFILIRRPWASYTLQAFLLLSSVEWLRTTIILVMTRKEIGEPYLRLVFILGGVSLFTSLAALIFQTIRIKAYFRRITVAP